MNAYGANYYCRSSIEIPNKVWNTPGKTYWFQNDGANWQIIAQL